MGHSFPLRSLHHVPVSSQICSLSDIAAFLLSPRLSSFLPLVLTRLFACASVLVANPQALGMGPTAAETGRGMPWEAALGFPAHVQTCTVSWAPLLRGPPVAFIRVLTGPVVQKALRPPPEGGVDSWWLNENVAAPGCPHVLPALRCPHVPQPSGGPRPPRQLIQTQQSWR